MRRTPIPCIAVLVAALACAAETVDDDDEWADEDSEGQTDAVPRQGSKDGEAALTEIAYIQHGVPYDAGGKPLAFALEDVAKMQAKLVEPVRQELDQKAAQNFDDVRKKLQSLQLTGMAAVIAEDQALVWASEQLDAGSDARRAAQQVAVVARGMPEYRPTLWASTTLSTTVLELGLLDPSPLSDKFGQAYIDECVANEVPIPPDWPDGWEFVGDEATNTIKVYRYPAASASPPPGICLALPRVRELASGELEIVQLGIICQNNVTGRACFWDNIVPRGTITGPLDTPMHLVELANGNTLLQNCTECHRGDNVFVVPRVRTGDPMTGSVSPLFGLRSDTASAAWYTPVSSQEEWDNPPAFMARNPSATGCTNCHGIGERSPGYCMRVVDSALPVMPPAGFSPPTLDPVQLAADKAAIVAHCAGG